MKAALVLEGGGMRGLYTQGVLDVFIEENIKFDFTIGVSAGACSSLSYISGQKGRNKRVNLDYLDDSRYISIQNFIKTGSMFGMDFLFNEIPNKLDLFDYEAFYNSHVECFIGVTDIVKGETVFFDKSALFNKDVTLVKASSSIPVFAPIVEHKGGFYLDGGTGCPIPAKAAAERGAEKIVVILTRDRDYVKKQEKFRFIYKIKYKKYPGLIKLLDMRHEIYNGQLNYIRKLEKEGKAFVIAPLKPLKISRFEKNKANLSMLFEEGYKDGKKYKQEILKFLNVK